MTTAEDYIRRRFIRAVYLIDDCPRCGPCRIIPNPDDALDASRCWFCGMDVESEGPARPPQFEGICTKETA